MHTTYMMAHPLTRFLSGIYPDYTLSEIFYLMSDSQPLPQDDIQIVLRAEKNVVHEKVRVNVGIRAKIETTTSEPEFRARINSTLKQFIDAEWKISSINRSKSSGKFEQVAVAATARVPETENYQLQTRANELSQSDFELLNPQVDYELTFDEIQTIHQELRSTLLESALKETTLMNGSFHKLAKALRQEFRVSSSRFEIDNGSARLTKSISNQPFRAHAMMASMSPAGGAQQAEGFGDAADDFDDEVVSSNRSTPSSITDFNVSTRFGMTGFFIMRSVVKD